MFYGLLVGPTNLVINKKLRGPNLTLKKFEEMDLRLKTKFTSIKNHDPETCYEEISESDSDGISSASEGYKLNNNSKLNAKEEEKQRERRNKANQLIIENYKSWIKRFDLLVTILAFTSCILSQIENEDYYISNKDNRTLQINLINFMRSNGITNRNTSSQLLNNSNYISFHNEFNISTEHILSHQSFESVQINLKASSFVPLICLSKYYEYIKDIEYQDKLDTSFFHTDFGFLLVSEILIMSVFQYPSFNYYLIEIELDNCIVIPYSTVLSTLTFLRIYFITKPLKHLTFWTSTEAEHVCEKHVCSANLGFAFKAFQKENPFLALVMIFVFTCVCFGQSLRSYELYFWETQSLNIPNYQNWEYFWNSLWCIFVSMTTVGYGDFYPKTHIGRFIAISACMVGVYFVSIMMVFMNQASDLNTNEFKAFKLLTRLRKRQQIKDLRAKIIHHALLMSKHKLNINSEEINLIESKKKYMYEKRNITSHIEEIKKNMLIIKSFDITPTQEHLYDISERIKQNIIEIRDHLDSLSYINETLLNFTDSQIEVAKYLKNNCYATKLLYSVIEKKRIFGKLNNLDFSLKNVFEHDVDKTDDNNKFYEQNNTTLNPQDPGLINNNHEENIFGSKLDIDEIRSHFNIIFTKEKLTHLRNQKKGIKKKSTSFPKTTNVSKKPAMNKNSIVL